MNHQAAVRSSNLPRKECAREKCQPIWVIIPNCRGVVVKARLEGSVEAPGPSLPGVPSEGSIIDLQLLPHTWDYREFTRTSERLELTPPHPAQGKLLKIIELRHFHQTLSPQSSAFPFRNRMGTGRKETQVLPLGRLRHQAPGRESRLLTDGEQMFSL